MELSRDAPSPLLGSSPPQLHLAEFPSLPFSLLAALAAIPAHAACEKLDVPPGYVATPMLPSQYHFMQGFWVGFPATPKGLPPGDGALVLTKKGSDDGVIFMTKAKGKIACALMPAPKILLEYLKGMKDGPGEAL